MGIWLLNHLCHQIEIRFGLLAQLALKLLQEAEDPVNTSVAVEDGGVSAQVEESGTARVPTEH